MEELTIGEIAQLVGVQTSTLRYYESIGLLSAPKRVSGQRRYSRNVLQILAVIQLAKDANFTLPEIRDLLYGFADNPTTSERWKELATQKLREIEVVIRQAQEMKVLLEESLRCESLLFELDSIFLPDTPESAAL